MSLKHEMNPVLGIDLGTTFSAIACWDDKKGVSRAYVPHGGSETLQSVVYYDGKEFVVGKPAYTKGIMSPENMALGVKRHMDDGHQKIMVGGKEFTPIELSARILRKLYEDVEGMAPEGVFKSRGTVVTVPYYFKAHQCENTRKAAELADIHCLGIIQEPIAASLAYAWQLVQEDPEVEGRRKHSRV